jgi:hypothetical protein
VDNSAGAFLFERTEQPAKTKSMGINKKDLFIIATTVHESHRLISINGRQWVFYYDNMQAEYQAEVGTTPTLITGGGVTADPSPG